jgi:hypothetical protein
MDASRRISLAIAVSLLAHASLLLLRPLAPEFKPPGPLADTPMTVVITPPELPAEPVPEPAPQPPAAEARPQPAPRPRAPPAPRRVEPMPPPVAGAPVAPAPPVEAPRAETPPPLDMLAMIEQRRAERRAAEDALRAPKSEGPKEDAADRNLRTLTGREGVGGVFQVLRISSCSGEFAFNGWKPDARSQWREVIEVDAPCGQVELAMIRRMIELIRTHYQGDFNWESHLLGRVVVLSARPADQRELEDFMFREFFGTPLANPRASRQPMR